MNKDEDIGQAVIVYGVVWDMGSHMTGVKWVIPCKQVGDCTAEQPKEKRFQVSLCASHILQVRDTEGLFLC